MNPHVPIKIDDDVTIKDMYMTNLPNPFGYDDLSAGYSADVVVKGYEYSVDFDITDFQKYTYTTLDEMFSYGFNPEGYFKTCDRCGKQLHEVSITTLLDDDAALWYLNEIFDKVDDAAPAIWEEFCKDNPDSKPYTWDQAEINDD